MTITKEDFFKPGKISAQDKASITDASAKGIISAETAARDSKTERLKQLRLEREATTSPSEIKLKRKSRTVIAR